VKVARLGAVSFLLAALSVVQCASADISPADWNPARRNWGGNGADGQTYNGGVVPENVHFDGGVCRLEAHGNLYKGDVKGVGRRGVALESGVRTGACIVSKKHMHYGSYRVKMKVAGVMGCCTAIWPFRYVEDGKRVLNHEIDIEMPGRPAERLKDIGFDYALCNTWVGENEGEYTTGYTKLPRRVDDGKFHEFGIDWHPKQVDFFLDGEKIRTTRKHVPTLPAEFWIGVWFPKGWTGTPDFDTAEAVVSDFSYTPFREGLPKIVGVWDHTGQGLHGGNWEKTMAALAEAGVTDVFMDCRIHKNRFSGDMVKACAAAGKAHGIRVHVWICCFQGAEREPTPQSRRDEVAGWAERIARDYEVDGIHLDYVRWSSKSRAERQPELLTGFVREVSRRVRKARPGILLSAAVFPSYPDCRDDVGQDWNDWIDYGLVDYVLPMNYTDSDKKYTRYLDQQTASACRAAKTISGIGVTTGDVTLDADAVRRQTALALDRGMAGVCYFDLDKTFETEIMPMLARQREAREERRE